MMTQRHDRYDSKYAMMTLISVCTTSDMDKRDTAWGEHGQANTMWHNIWGLLDDYWSQLDMLEDGDAGFGSYLFCKWAATPLLIFHSDEIYTWQHFWLFMLWLMEIYIWKACLLDWWSLWWMNRLQEDFRHNGYHGHQNHHLVGTLLAILAILRARVSDFESKSEMNISDLTSVI